MKIPAWLDPFWHLDYEITSVPNAPAALTTLLAVNGRLRAYRSSETAVRVVRRGGFMNGFVLARVTVERGVSVHIARPAVAVALMMAAFLFVVVWPLIQLLLSAVLDRSRLLQSALFFFVGGLIWASVIGVNYTSAKSEARDLERLINQALGVAS